MFFGWARVLEYRQPVPTIILGPLIVLDVGGTALYLHSAQSRHSPTLKRRALGGGRGHCRERNRKSDRRSGHGTLIGLNYTHPKGYGLASKDAFKNTTYCANEVTAMAYRDQPLGELALSIPRIGARRQYDMDYCCGGKRVLARAAARHGVVLTSRAQLAQLAGHQPIEKDWRAGFRWRTL